MELYFLGGLLLKVEKGLTKILKRGGLLVKVTFYGHVHYNTFPIIEQDVKGFKETVEKEISSEVIILEPSGSFEIE